MSSTNTPTNTEVGSNATATIAPIFSALPTPTNALPKPKFKKKERAKTSWVWKYLTFDVGSNFCVCRICNTELGHATNATSNLIEHFMFHHQDKVCFKLQCVFFCHHNNNKVYLGTRGERKNRKKKQKAWSKCLLSKHYSRSGIVCTHFVLFLFCRFTIALDNDPNNVRVTDALLVWVTCAMLPFFTLHTSCML